MRPWVNRLGSRLFSTELLCCALLLAPFCLRIWGLGITTADDGLWALWVHQPDQHPILDFAVGQGRLWGFGGGGLIALGLWFAESWFGNALIVGSFLLFFVLFGLVVRACWSASVAFTAAGFFLALSAFRADRSILYAYPLFFWVPASAVLTAMLLARRYQRTGGWLWLGASLPLFVLGLFNNEGASLLSLIAFAAALLAAYRQAPDRSGIAARRRFRCSVAVHGFGGGAFVVASAIWRWLHPSAYSGNNLAPFDGRRIATTLFNFVTSGTVPYDFVHPYVQTFYDTLLPRAVRIVYAPGGYWRDALTTPVSLLVGGLAAGLLGRAILRQIGAGGSSQWRGAAACVVAGLTVATVPLIPVAMTSQYQSWFYLYDAHAYSHTIVATFGLALAAAGLCRLLMTAIPLPAGVRYGIAVIVSIGSGVVAMLGNQMNDAIARDFRPEGARWRAVAAVARMAAASGHPADIVAMPRLRNGSWFAMMPPGYWSDYARDVLGSGVRLNDHELSLNELAQGAGYADYRLDRDGRHFAATLAHIAPGAGTAAAAVADQLTVLVEDANATTPDRILAFDDIGGGSLQVPLRDMTPAGKGLWTLSGLQAAPTSARVVDQSAWPKLVVGCGASAPLGIKLVAASMMPAGPGCLAGAYLKQGWTPAGPAGTWSNDRVAVIDLPLDGVPPPRLQLRIDASSYTGLGFFDALQTIRLRINGRLAATWPFRPGRNPIEPVDVGADEWLSASPGKSVLPLQFDVDPPYQPKRLGLGADERELGLMLRSITLEPATGPRSNPP